MKYDDDLVIDVSEEEVLGLKGGGDWHTAYLIIYKKTGLRADIEEMELE